MTFGVNDEEVLHLRTSYLFPRWTDRNFDTYFQWLANVPDAKVLRFIFGWDYGDGIPNVDLAGFADLCAAADRAGVKLIPQLMHSGGATRNAYTLTGSRYGSLVAWARDIMARYSYDAVSAWDLFNEMDVNGPFTSPTQYGLWVRRLVSDVRSSTMKPITVGHQGFGGGLWNFSQAVFNLMNDVPGMDIAHVHWYGPDPNPGNTIGNYLGVWARALGKPCLAGEFGSNGRYWPEFVPLWTYGDAITMYLDGYPGYPFAGPVNLPPPPPPPPPPAPGPDLTAILADIARLKKHTHGVLTESGEPLLPP